MLRTRILTGAILLSVGIIVLGVLRIPWLTLALMSSFVALGGIEYAGMRWGDAANSATEVQTPPFRRSHMVLGFLYVLPMIIVHVLVEMLGQPVLVLPFMMGFFVIAGLFLGVFLYQTFLALKQLQLRLHRIHFD